MPRHAPIPPLTIELAPVYRCGATGRRYLSERGAYLKAAANAVAEAYAEDLESEDWGQMPASMAYDDQRQYERVTQRLARWLRWRDGRRAAIAAQWEAP